MTETEVPVEEPPKDSVTIQKATVWKVIVGVLLVAFVVLWFYKGDTQQPSAPQPSGRIDVSLDDDPVLGKLDAPVTIVEFSDFQCPYCGKFFQETFPSIKAEYIDTGKVKWVYRDFPLASIHPEATAAAEAAECAHEQGVFWEFHDMLFENQADLSFGRLLYVEAASELKVDEEQFLSCIDGRKYQAEVQEDFNYGSSIGVSGTPAFFINGQMLVGALPIEMFRQRIEAELE